MSQSNPLYVPVAVRALAVTADTLKNTQFLRWQYNYSNLSNFLSPLGDPRKSAANPAPGVYLHWELPRIMREGVDSGGNVTFPLVPNRWLVVRYMYGCSPAQQPVGWVIQSDYLPSVYKPATNAEGAPYVYPLISPCYSFQPTAVGQNVALSSWTEPFPPGLFLTAVAPGNNMFAAFQPYCGNVFSFYDSLAGLKTVGTLSYFVAGWSSALDNDILSACTDKQNFGEFLAKAGWTVPPGSASDDEYIPMWGIYHGGVTGMPYGTVTGNNVPSAEDLRVAVGNTTVEALTSLAKANGLDALPHGVTPDVLEALQLGMLPYYDKADAAQELRDDIARSKFGARSGGFAWEIVDAPTDGQPSASPAPPAQATEQGSDEDTWLAALNQAQLAYEQAAAALVDQQGLLYEAFWKYGFLQHNPPAQQPADNDGNAGANAYREAVQQSRTDLDDLETAVGKAQTHLATLAAAIPTGATQEALQAAIQAYAENRNLPASRQLRQVARRPFYKPVDPVVLIQGLKAENKLFPSEPVYCRFANQLVTGLTWTATGAPVTSATPPNAIQKVDVAQISKEFIRDILPTSVGNLDSLVKQWLELAMQEFYFLDPDNAGAIATGTNGLSSATVSSMITSGDYFIGVKPDLNLAWVQPWSPLALLWDISWHAIPYSDNNSPAWTFNGSDYTWNGTSLPSAPAPVTYQGLSFLTEQASFNFRAQVEKLILEIAERGPMLPGQRLHETEDSGVSLAEQLHELIEQSGRWDFLSSSLGGLSPMMYLRDPAPNVTPAVQPPGNLTQLVGNAATYALLLPTPVDPPPPSNFQDLRAGQFRINGLYVVDRFGQTCQVYSSSVAGNPPLVVSSSMTPQSPLDSSSPPWAQLPPRLLQPARLNFDWISATNDNDVLGLAASVNPLCGWLMHNFQDESILVYSPAGQFLGAMRVVTSGTQQEVAWHAAPGGEYTSLDKLLAVPALAQLGNMLSAVAASPDVFHDLQTTVDEASWNIAADETTSDIGLALVAGRPVAVVRTKLEFQFEGAVIDDPSWQYSLTPKPNPVTTWPFPVVLGEPGKLQDGLIGYFAQGASGTDYSKLYAPTVPSHPKSSYVAPVGKGLSLTVGGPAAFLTLLMDPRAAVHAATGILPVIGVTLPPALVEGALSRMEVVTEAGPVLTASVMPDGGSAADLRVVMPRPFTKNGTWTWQEAGAPPLEIIPATPTAEFSNVPVVLRHGLLSLSGALEIDPKKSGSE
jgi:hypothetical protein